MASLAERVRRAAPGRLVGAAYVLAHLGAVGVGLWVVGDISNEPYDSPDGGSTLGVRLPAPLYGDGPGTAVAGAVGVALVTVAVLLGGASARGLSRGGAAWLWLSLVWSGVVGLAVGAALRVVFAITWDANIGGGLLLLVGLPVLAFAWVAGSVPLTFARRTGQQRSERPDAPRSVLTQVVTVVLWAFAAAMVIAVPFNLFTLADGLYWTVCSDPVCGDGAALGQLVLGSLGLVVAAAAVVGAALWHRRARRSGRAGGAEPSG